MTYEELVELNKNHIKTFQINDLDKDLYEFRLKYVNGDIVLTNKAYPQINKPFNDITDIIHFYSLSEGFYIKNISFLRNYSYVYKKYCISETDYEEIHKILREISQVEKIDAIIFKKIDNLKVILGKLVLQGCAILWKDSVRLENANIAVIRVKNNIYVYSDCIIVLSDWPKDRREKGHLFSMLNCKKLYIDNIDISNLEYIRYGFADSITLQEIELKNFDTSNVKNMTCLFYNCRELRKVNLEVLNTKQVIFLDDMFKNCKNIEKVDLRTFDISNVRSMTGMFMGCENLKEVDISTWKVKKSQINIMLFFANCISLKEVKGLENLKGLTSKVVSLGYCPYIESKRKEDIL